MSTPHGPDRSSGSEPRLTAGLLAALGFVGMAGSTSTDLYLPAFPDLQEHFGVAASAVQLTLTGFLIGAALGQFVVGTVSDALGRRRTLVIALAAFCAIGFGAALAPSLEVLVLLRFLQGLTGSAGAALARAIVADIAVGDRAARGISVVIAMMGVGPVLGSPLGAGLTALGGWRLALGGLAVIAAAMWLTALLAVPETLPPERRHPARLGAMLHNLGGLLRNGAYVGYALSYALSYAAMMVYIGSSSFVVQNVLGGSSFVYSLTFSAGAIAFVLGAWANGRLVRRMGALGMMRVAHLLMLLAGAVLVVLVSAGALSLWAWVPLVSLYMAGGGMSMSDGSALTLRHAAGVAGAGSAAMGLSQFALGAMTSPLGGLWGDETALPTAIGMVAVTALAAAALTIGRRFESRG